MRISKAQQIRQLEARVAYFVAEKEADLTIIRVALSQERTMRLAAQKGLWPYVDALEQFARWLKQRPNATAQQVIAKMTALGIWDIKVGHNPHDEELQQSVASVQRA